MREQNRDLEIWQKGVIAVMVLSPAICIKRCVNIFVLLLIAGIYSFAYCEEEKVFRTGLEAKRGNLSVSPDGKRLLFGTDRLAHGLRLMNLSNGEIRTIPIEAGRIFEYPSWSPDGQRVVVVSAAIRDNRFNVDDMKILLVDPGTWESRPIASGEGVKFFPFFSQDGKTVYYFKGKKRESGKTVASHYDLFAVDLANAQEIQLTREEFYQAVKGDAAPNSVLFSAIPNFNRKLKDALGKEARSAMFLYNKASKIAAPIAVDQSSGIFDFSDPQRDKAGNLYFVSAKARQGGGNFLWFLVRSDKDGNNPQLLTELPISMGFDIARNTGEIFVMDKDDKELIIRKLTVKAAI